MFSSDNARSVAPATRRPSERQYHRLQIRYKKKGAKRASTIVTDGDRNTLLLTDLEADTLYQVKVAAQTVNGTGPYTKWLSVVTAEGRVHCCMFCQSYIVAKLKISWEKEILWKHATRVQNSIHNMNKPLGFTAAVHGLYCLTQLCSRPARPPHPPPSRSFSGIFGTIPNELIDPKGPEKRQMCCIAVC